VYQDKEGEEQQRPESSEWSRAEEEKAASRRQRRKRKRARMPCLNVSTNVNLEGVDTSAILAEASKSVANIIGKPEAVSLRLPLPLPLWFPSCSLLSCCLCRLL